MSVTPITFLPGSFHFLARGRELAVPLLAHRLVLDPDAAFAGFTRKSVLEEITRTIPVPG